MTNPERLEILITCGSNSWGGLEIMALDSAFQLKNYGSEVYLFCPEDSDLHNRAKEYGIDTIVYGFESGAISKIRKLSKFLSENKIRIIHTHHSHDLWTVVPAMKTAHSKAALYLTKHIASGIKKKDIFHKYLYSRVDKIFAISIFIRQNVIDTCPVPESKVILLHNGIDTNKFNRSRYNRNEIRNEYCIPEDKITVALIGRITPGKGHFEFIKAAEIINRTYSKNIVFLVIGSAEQGEERIEQEIRQLAKEKNITNIVFTGHRTNIAGILLGIDILTFPSHEESFGITLLEAMAMEVPVVACSNAGVTDIIPSDEYGILTAPKDPGSLASGIIKLLEDADLRKKLANNAKKRVEEKFSAQKLIREQIKHYDI